jgi:hypothetical protein
VVEAGDVELGLGIVATELLGDIRGDQPVGADHLAAAVIAHQQVHAVLVEAVAVDAGLDAFEASTHLLAKDTVTKALRFAHLVGVAGEIYRQ